MVKPGDVTLCIAAARASAVGAGAAKERAEVGVDGIEGEVD